MFVLLHGVSEQPSDVTSIQAAYYSPGFIMQAVTALNQALLVLARLAQQYDVAQRIWFRSLIILASALLLFPDLPSLQSPTRVRSGLECVFACCQLYLRSEE